MENGNFGARGFECVFAVGTTYDSNRKMLFPAATISSALQQLRKHE